MTEDCAQCREWPGACPAHAAFWSGGGAGSAGRAIVCIDIAGSASIRDLVARTARSSEARIVELRLEPDIEQAAAGAVKSAKESGAAVVVLPHSAAGCAVAARVAVAISAAELTACDELEIGASGEIKAVRSHFGGLVLSTARVGMGPVVATLHPRRAVATTPPMPAGLARRLLLAHEELIRDHGTAVRECADALGLLLVPSAQLPATLIADICVTAGVDGSTQINTALRGCRVVVALVSDASAQIVNAADHVLVGDVADHMRAIVGVLGHR